MRLRPRSTVAVAAALCLAVAGCGSSAATKKENRALDAFFTRTARGRALGKRFPHRPGSVGCTVLDHQLHQRVPATCATDVAVGQTRVIAIFTESWSHGSRTHTWFVFLRPDGTIESITQEGVAPAG